MKMHNEYVFGNSAVFRTHAWFETRSSEGKEAGRQSRIPTPLQRWDFQILWTCQPAQRATIPSAPSTLVEPELTICQAGTKSSRFEDLIPSSPPQRLMFRLLQSYVSKDSIERRAWSGSHKLLRIEVTHRRVRCKRVLDCAVRLNPLLPNKPATKRQREHRFQNWPLHKFVAISPIDQSDDQVYESEPGRNE